MAKKTNAYQSRFFIRDVLFRIQLSSPFPGWLRVMISIFLFSNQFIGGNAKVDSPTFRSRWRSPLLGWRRKMLSIVFNFHQRKCKKSDELITRLHYEVIWWNTNNYILWRKVFKIVWILVKIQTRDNYVFRLIFWQKLYKLFR